MEADKEILSRLIARLKAEEFDTSINGDIAKLIGWTFEKMKGHRVPYWRAPGERREYMRDLSPPKYTESLDAAVSFAKTMHSDCTWSIFYDGASLWTPEVGNIWFGGSPALSLIIVTLIAKLREMGEEI